MFIAADYIWQTSASPLLDQLHGELESLKEEKVQLEAELRKRLGMGNFGRDFKPVKSVFLFSFFLFLFCLQRAMGENRRSEPYVEVDARPRAYLPRQEPRRGPVGVARRQCADGGLAKDDQVAAAARMEHARRAD